MNLDNTLECSYPFKHWELSKCLNNETLNMISSYLLQYKGCLQSLTLDLQDNDISPEQIE